ncbi:glycoside hydrolase family protein [Bacteroides fragilis]|jgi:hypothetical protein|uniref:CARDB domain-containing protein n=1 Tax=Bacteroides fragilis TaxID=817 RepID=A0A853Q183_BACFG|nr:glycoside hydrolase family protein [Bacteroides fragilis]EYA41080.1 hypothetical protein M075_0350 [Bacteroides fragilis str. 20793-3]MCS2356451.1 glycoside hydrolase family protein [Bacteroides fragilis]OCR36064.1 hypothetical protein AC094_03790 [Bacteroides fragilis]PJY67134.1 hypothetical protein CQW35_00956 [Bacteroides fragilis]
MNVRIRRRISIAIVTCATALSALAQITERQRPAEWDKLIPGGKYVDRFEAMQGNKLSDKVWGAQEVLPRFVDNGIEHPDISFWGGNILRGEDGKYHLFVCGWPENAKKGHMEWPNSTVYHAISKQLHGPYAIQDTIGKGHNPEAFILADGRIVVYVINGYYLADSVDGPWEFKQFDFNPRDRKIIEGLSNLTFAERQDGSRLMICRGGGVWISRSGLSPYNQITERRAYPNVKGEFEDPVVWRDSLQYHLIVNDWLGRIAFYQRSLDGVHWVTEQGEAYVPGISRHKDGKVENWFKYERAKVYQDKEGRPIQMNFAVIDTIKWEDHGNDNHSSKNICIPLKKDLLLSVLNTAPIDASTPTIEVRIAAEKGFNPDGQLDIPSLRFGSFNEVNFGRGCKPLSWKKEGKDLIVTFEGKESGITAEEFAPKLIGKDKKGEFVIGYARLPYINYTPAILSSLRPRYDETGKLWKVEVQNFGLSTSEEMTLKITSNGLTVVETLLPPLKPYETKTLSIKGENRLEDQQLLSVKFYRNGNEIAVNKF